MATQKTKVEKLVEEAEALGLTVTKEDNEATLTEKIKVKKQEIADAKKAEAEAKKAEAEEAKNKKIFYLVKVKSFINDSETVEAGLYQTKTPNERLERSKKDYVEVFNGKISDAKLFEIAKLYRVAIFEKNGNDTRPSADILAELVKDL